MSSAPGSIATLSTRTLVSPAEYRDALDIDVKRVLSQTAAIQQIMQTVMKKDVHYGVIDGTDKPTLYQAGADKLCMLFRLKPSYRTDITTRRDFISVVSTCTLVHIPTREEWGEGQGWANSREDKYAAQASARVCPHCKKQAIHRSRNEERDGSRGWFCWAKKGGCGVNFKAADPLIENQGNVIIGDKVWNLANTILKIANKRSKAASVLTATGAADIFTQDLDDLEEAYGALGDDDGAKKPTAPPANGANGAAHPAGANVAQPPTSGANGSAAPANNGAATAPASNGNGIKRAGPLQIRELRGALGSNLQTTEPERQIAWCNGMLPKGRQIVAFNDLTPEETVNLTKAAENGEVPGGAEK